MEIVPSSLPEANIQLANLLGTMKYKVRNRYRMVMTNEVDGKDKVNALIPVP